jgi:hypothetical protein
VVDHLKEVVQKLSGRVSDFNRLVLRKGCGSCHKGKNKGQDSPAKDIFHTFE